MKPKKGKPPVSVARLSAYEILRRVEAEGAYASVLASGLPADDLSPQDRALAREIGLGVLRWRLELDHLIERYSERSVARLDLPVLLALRIGLYQIRHLARIPHSAAVNESVNLVKLKGLASASGLVNAVLRKAARLKDEPVGSTLSDPAERASVELSHPRWLLARWSRFMEEREAHDLALANNQPPGVALRVNPLKGYPGQILDDLNRLGVVLRPSSYVAGAYVVESGLPEVARAIDDGLIYLQDEASQLISVLLSPEPGERILDICAAPGSKTSHIAALTANKAWVVAGDLHPHRLVTLRRICSTLGATVDTVVMDATKGFPLSPAANRFHRILVDAPCTGTGTLRQNPEIKWRLREEDPARMRKVQEAMLANASTLIVDGGRLVYSTCSIEREENEDVVVGFLTSGAPFRVVTPEVGRDLITEEGFVRTFPHRHGTDGFFGAVLEKIS